MDYMIHVLAGGWVLTQHLRVCGRGLGGGGGSCDEGGLGSQGEGWCHDASSCSTTQDGAVQNAACTRQMLTAPQVSTAKHVCCLH
jgi:hypothetical protein